MHHTGQVHPTSLICKKGRAGGLGPALLEVLLVVKTLRRESRQRIPITIKSPVEFSIFPEVPLPQVGPAGFWRAIKKIPRIVVLVFRCLIYVQERREMGQIALETTLNELEHVL